MLALPPGEGLESRDEADEVLEDVAHVVGQPPQRGLDVVAVDHHVGDAVLQLFKWYEYQPEMGEDTSQYNFEVSKSTDLWYLF